MRRSLQISILTGAVFCSTGLLAQPPGFAPPTPASPMEQPQVDITGYWVALVTEDWLWRMVTPPKGDVTSVPVNQQGRRAANAWDLEQDNTNGEQCKAFGAAGLMRQPVRLHITWENDHTLRIDSDIGEQTRLLNFETPENVPAGPTWQGISNAQWTRATGGFDMRAMFGGGRPSTTSPEAGLKVVTTGLREGYLRKNGVPYSQDTTLTEYFTSVSAAGNDYLVVMSIVEDPRYLNSPYVTSSHFKREPDGANWTSSPCFTAPPASEGQ